MSSREPLWYCHECSSEMRPLMMPDPRCSTCRGSFVEKMDDPTNDPRDFTNTNDESPLQVDLFTLMELLNPIGASRYRHFTTPPRDTSGSPRSVHTSSLHFAFDGITPRRPDILRGAETGDEQQSTNTSRRLPEQTRGPGIGASNGLRSDLLTQYLMTLFGTGNPLFGQLGGSHGEGRYGDYVFTQDALDQIITQIMEGSNAHRPVPASEDVMKNLPRKVLASESPLLEKECAICKDEFSLNTEDEDELVVVTLPCEHPFHETCILPWLKSSGTCPVCRHALVPQPGGDPPGPSSSTERTASSSSSSNHPSHSIRDRFTGIFSNASHRDGRHRDGEGRTGSSSRSHGSTSRRGSENDSNNDVPDLPGSYHSRRD